MSPNNHPDTRLGARARQVVEGANRLGIHVFFELCRNRPGRNAVVSPQALAAGMLPLHAGAQGNTRSQLSRALGIVEGMPEQFDRQYWPLAHASNADDAVRLISAVSLWARRSLHLKSDFLRECQTIDAELASLDFDELTAYEAINDWARSRTNGQIDHFINAGEIAPGTILLILAVLYFKGRWAQPFDPAQTRTGLFKLADGTVQRPLTMRRTATFSYGEIGGCQTVELPFGSGQICMRMLLPAVPSIPENQIMDVLLQCSRLPERFGEVAIPRLKIDVSADLVEALTAVGLGVIFSPEAEFGRMSDSGAWIGRVKQRATVVLDEEGAEAAAAMSIQFIRTLAPAEFAFIVDRPFYWEIWHKESGLLLLVGFVADPNDC